MRIGLFALALAAAGCMEGRFPWARQEPPPFAHTVISEGMIESAVHDEPAAKQPDNKPAAPAPATSLPQASPLTWTIKDL